MAYTTGLTQDELTGLGEGYKRFMAGNTTPSTNPLKDATLGRKSGILQGPYLQADASGDVTGVSQGFDPNANGFNTAPPPPRGAPPVDVAATTTQQSPYDMILQMYNQSYEAQAQKLKALRDSRLAGMAGQDTLINNQATSDLNANDVSGARNASALREKMAAMGLLQGGDYISEQTAQNTAQGQNVNNINMDRAQRLQNLAAQKDAINNNASAEDLALLQQVNSDRMQAQLAQANADRGYQLDLSGLSGQLPGGGGQTIQGKAAELQNQGQMLQNKLSQFKIDDYPNEQKANAEKIKRDAELGNMDIETAKYNLEQLKNPDSPYNQAAKMDLEMKKIDLKNYSQTAQLELQKLQKTLAEIGKVHTQPQSANEIEMDKVKLQTAQETYKQLLAAGKESSAPKGSTAEEYYKYTDGVARYNTDQNTGTQVLSNPIDVETSILQSNLSEAEMKKLYTRYGLKWGG